MNQIKLTDLEIKEGWLCKDGVKLCKSPLTYNRITEGLGGAIGHLENGDKVKSATIWTEEIKQADISSSPDNQIWLYWNPKKTLQRGTIAGLELKEVLQAISQYPKAYATDIEI